MRPCLQVVGRLVMCSGGGEQTFPLLSGRSVVGRASGSPPPQAPAPEEQLEQEHGATHREHSIQPTSALAAASKRSRTLARLTDCHCCVLCRRRAD